ncbi:MAG: 4-(cytidine 5'-diphospho)-2-C-methyl-D-erythritol kinase [Chloroflexi bacterium RBG_16_57_8]|nr:MAG: 4-(cytidine 5'-diphospho)-2-C-methyl-D-erythritol kinase [Chloroflexi bacterium RBG_16_57_8]
MITISAPAKINLTLEVLGKRPDGYHEVRSVIQTISLADSLSFEMSDRLEFRSESAEWEGEKSLVSQAFTLMKNMAGAGKGATISVSKRIPLLSGLGGDSSDAAVTLLGLNELWGLGLTSSVLEPLARQLGSDVTFFLYGGTALVSGRGEIVTPLPPLPRRWVILALPQVPRLQGKTKLLYQSLRPNHYTDGSITQRLIDSLKSRKEFDESLSFNTFENVAFTVHSGLDVARQHMVKIGAPHIHLAGSGPTLFTMLRDKSEAEDLFARLEGQGMETYLTETAAN